MRQMTSGPNPERYIAPNTFLDNIQKDKPRLAGIRPPPPKRDEQTVSRQQQGDAPAKSRTCANCPQQGD